MLKYKLFKWFAALVLVFGVLAASLGIWVINARIVQEAQTRVGFDLKSAWAVYNSQLREMETIVRLVAARTPVVEACNNQKWDERATWDEVENILARHRADFKLQFLAIVSPDGQVRARGASPHARGDTRSDEPLIAKALAGNTASGTVILSRSELTLEGDKQLADEAFLPVHKTAGARPAPDPAEDRGMVMLAAAPVERGGRVVGAVYAGVLLNHNLAFVDRIQDIVFGKETYGGLPRGTTTVFLGDTRIATTVLLPSGNRALGTQVSAEVADRVLDNGKSWADRARVLEEWCLTAYDPIRDSQGKVIGMLYVGTLERPFRDLSHSMMLRYAALIAAALLVALLMAGFIAGRLARPLHLLAESANRMQQGKGFAPVPADKSCAETAGLTQSFNEMATALAQREHELKDANDQLGNANTSLKAINAQYMETLQFVSHELNSPLSSIMNYTYTLKQKLLGDLTDKQSNALDVMSANLKRVMEMIRHYLNLARIESGEIQPVPSKVAVREDVIAPILRSLENEIVARNLRVEDLIGPGVVLHSDLNMTREVFENLLSNAVKYGRPGGLIRLSCQIDGAWAQFAVRNEGDGIPPERRGDLFQKFSRLELRDSKKGQRGTGLGLFICKKIVESHGGTIAVDSEVGKWTEFRCTLPAARAASAAYGESGKTAAVSAGVVERAGAVTVAEAKDTEPVADGRSRLAVNGIEVPTDAIAAGPEAAKRNSQ